MHDGKCYLQSFVGKPWLDIMMQLLIYNTVLQNIVAQIFY